MTREKIVVLWVATGVAVLGALILGVTAGYAADAASESGGALGVSPASWLWGRGLSPGFRDSCCWPRCSSRLPTLEDDTTRQGSSVRCCWSWEGQLECYFSCPLGC